MKASVRRKKSKKQLKPKVEVNMAKEVTKEQELHLDEVLLDNIGIVTEVAVKRTLDKTNKTLASFISDAQTKIDGFFSGRPVYEFKFADSDAEPTKLSNRVSPILPRLMVNAKLGMNTLLVGPAGCGKTTLAHQLSEALKVNFGTVCLTAGASETWLFGRQTPTGFVEGMFSKIYREGGVFLADEMDAADANLLLSINTALSHDEMLNPMNGEVIKKHENFVFIGAANTNGKGSTHLYTGRSRLDAATLDRMVVIKVDYDCTLEKELCPQTVIYTLLNDIRASFKSQGYDEFISTRAFVSTYKQWKAGISPKEIFESLSSNWSEAAQKVASQKAATFLSSKQVEGKNIMLTQIMLPNGSLVTQNRAGK